MQLVGFCFSSTPFLATEVDRIERNQIFGNAAILARRETWLLSSVA
jgi:hypothetical protein